MWGPCSAQHAVHTRIRLYRSLQIADRNACVNPTFEVRLTRWRRSCYSLKGRVTKAQTITQIALFKLRHESAKKKKSTKAQVYWHETLKAQNCERQNNSPQQTVASKIPPDKPQATVTDQIVSQHVEENII